MDGLEITVKEVSKPGKLNVFVAARHEIVMSASSGDREANGICLYPGSTKSQ
jgi:hypothetical protein